MLVLSQVCVDSRQEQSAKAVILENRGSTAVLSAVGPMATMTPGTRVPKFKADTLPDASIAAIV